MTAAGKLGGLWGLNLYVTTVIILVILCRVE
jgi:hypothetical protein